MKAVVGLTLITALVALPLGTALAQHTQQPAQSPPAQSPPAQSQPAQSPPAQPQPSQAQQTQQQTGLTVASDSLIGTKVRDAQGNEIGEISKLLIDAKQGKVTSALIRQGGTLGMGGKEISVPWDSLTLQRGQNQQLVVTMQQQMLEQAPSKQAERERQQSPAASPDTSGQQERKQQ